MNHRQPKMLIMTFTILHRQILVFFWVKSLNYHRMAYPDLFLRQWLQKSLSAFGNFILHCFYKFWNFIDWCTDKLLIFLSYKMMQDDLRCYQKLLFCSWRHHSKLGTQRIDQKDNNYIWDFWRCSNLDRGDLFYAYYFHRWCRTL